MICDEVIAAGGYDLVIGDESWELDYHLHENPDLKKTAFVWMTDFVGYLPMPDSGDREAFVAADYNAEMITQIERYGQIHDKAIFVGTPDDIVPDRFGPDLPYIREWTEAHYDFAGYVTGFDPAALGDRDELPRRIGISTRRTICASSPSADPGLALTSCDASPPLHRRLGGRWTVFDSSSSPGRGSIRPRCRQSKVSSIDRTSIGSTATLLVRMWPWSRVASRRPWS